MLSQIQDAMLPMLVAGIVGMLIGAAFVAFRKGRAQSAQPGEGAPATPHPVAAARPAAVAPASTRTARAPRAAGAPTLPEVADLLLVDDSAVARAKLRRLFEPAGYKVQLASDGVEALALLERGRYGLMITDLEMPNMDGPTLIKNCQARPESARMPILAITGHESLRRKFEECRHICGLHRKPWVDDILMSHVATLVAPRPARRAAPIH